MVAIWNFDVGVTWKLKNLGSLNNYMDQSYTWKADSRSAGKEIRSRPQLYRILCYWNSVLGRRKAY